MNWKCVCGVVIEYWKKIAIVEHRRTCPVLREARLAQETRQQAAALRAAELRGVRAGLEAAAKGASLFSLEKRSIHPDFSWDELHPIAQAACHQTCQQVAASIRDIDPASVPVGKEP